MIDPQELNNSDGRRIFTDFLNEKFKNNTSALAEKFDLLTDLYLQFNSAINISALRTLDDIYVKHYLDSIFPFTYFRGNCCDVGCGGGFPCIPLALVTGLFFTGIDGVGKKLGLIKRAAAELQLENISGSHIRAEELARVRTFDTVCARAVADMDKVLSFCAPLAENSGKIILYKTQSDDKATLKTEKKYKVELIDVIDYTLPSTDINRRLFIYEKHA